MLSFKNIQSNDFLNISNSHVCNNNISNAALCTEPKNNIAIEYSSSSISSNSKNMIDITSETCSSSFRNCGNICSTKNNIAVENSSSSSISSNLKNMNNNVTSETCSSSFSLCNNICSKSIGRNEISSTYNNDCNSIDSFNNSCISSQCTNYEFLESSYNFDETECDKNIVLKNVAPHIVSSFDKIKIDTYKSFLFLSLSYKQSTKKKFSDVVTKSRLTIESQNFHAKFAELSIENMFLYFKINIALFKIAPNGSFIRLHSPNLTFKGTYKGMIIFDQYKIYVLRTYIKKFIQFPTKSSNFCSLCGHLFICKAEHAKNCKVTGTDLNIADKILSSSACGNSNLSEILDALKIREAKNSTETTVYLKRNISAESTSTVMLDTIENARTNIFGLFFYNDYYSKHESNKRNLKAMLKTEQFKLALAKFKSQHTEINLPNLEEYFHQKLKIYVKGSMSNKLLPCEFHSDPEKNYKTYVAYIVDAKLLCPRSHLFKQVTVSGPKPSFCKTCAQYYPSLTAHMKKCKARCSKCLQNCQTPNKSMNPETVVCIKCRIDFNSQDCFDKHFDRACMRMYICGKCKGFVNKLLYKSKHECHSRFCGTCRKTVSKTDYAHQCVIRKKKLCKRFKNSIHVFYDTETFLSESDESFFTPCILTCQLSCDFCTIYKTTESSTECNFCHNTSKVFLGLECIEKFIQYLLELEIRYSDLVSNIYTIGQNCAKFDTHFLYSYCLTHTGLLRHVPVMKGNKILLLCISHKIKCVDSYLYLPLPLHKFAKTFKLPETKSFFPHDWFSCAKFFKNYVRFPPFEAFTDNRMTLLDYEKMKESVCDVNGKFYVQRLLIKYCMQDTQILRLGFDKYLKLMVSKFSIHPLQGTITYSSLTYKIWNTLYMPENSVYVLDNSSVLSNASKLQYEWLFYIKKQINTHAYQLITGRDPCGEVNVWCGSRRLKLDGCIVDRATKKLVVALEMLGCRWHGHLINGRPCKLNNSGDIQLYVNTMERLKLIQLHYKLHYTWECEYREKCKSDEKVKAISAEFQEANQFGFFQNDQLMQGGRVEVFQRYCKASENESILYYDVTSLYPFIQASSLFPIKEFYKLFDDDAPTVPQFIKMMKENPNTGAALISILAPKQLLHPVLGCKLKGKLRFALCTACAKHEQFPCNHDDSERLIVGVYTYPEIELALEMGYELKKVYEVLYCKSTAPIFKDSVNDIIGLKIAYSGYPETVKTDEQKQAYVNSYREQGINITTEQMQSDDSGKFPFKVAANALWGRLAMNTDKFKSIGIVSDTDELIGLLEGKGKHKIEQIINSITSDTVMYLYSSDEKVKSRDSNILLSAYVTSLSRVYLYRAIQWAGENLIYCDTDSIIMRHKNGNPEFPGVGGLLGDWTSEVGEGKRIIEFVSSSPKCYALKILTSENKIEYIAKLKGTTLDPKDAKATFEKIKATVFVENSEIPMASKQFQIQQGGGGVYLKNSVKILKDSSRKRHVLENKINSLPFGWVEF